MVETSHRNRILFVATREPSYPRVAMTLASLSKVAEVDALVCENPSYFWRIITIGWRFLVCDKSRYDVVFVGFFAQPVMPWIRLFWRGPVVADVFISLYDSLVLDKGWVGSGGWVALMAKWLDRYALRGCDVALVDTLEHQRLFELIGVGQRLPRFYRLWASAEEEIFRRTEPLAFEKESGAVFEVLFWGAFIPLQGVEVIVSAAALLDQKRVRLTVVGTGQTYAECRGLAEDLNLENLEFVAWQTPEQLVERASRAHLLLGIFGRTEKAKRVIPNKAFQALALGKPLLTGRSVGIAELLTEGEDVLLCQMGNAEDLADKIEWTREHYDVALRVGQAGYATFLERAGTRDREAVLAQVLTVF